MKITTVLLIGFGGFTGTMPRYLSSVFATKYYPAAPFLCGKFVVNNFLPDSLSGCTTFSAFACGNITMLQQFNYSGFALYNIRSFIFCLVTVFAGLSLIKTF